MTSYKSLSARVDGIFCRFTCAFKLLRAAIERLERYFYSISLWVYSSFFELPLKCQNLFFKSQPLGKELGKSEFD